MLAALVEEHEAGQVGEGTHASLKKALLGFRELETDDRCDIVRAMRLEKMFEKSKKRLVVCVDNTSTTIRKELIAGLTAVGAQRKVGKAPPGAMERAIQGHLESSGKGSGKSGAGKK